MFRLSFKFEMYGQGWSENYYRQSAFLPTQSNLVEAVITSRLNLLSTAGRMTGLRISNTDSKRDVVVWPTLTPARGGGWTLALAQEGGGVRTLGTEPEDTFTSLLIRMDDGNNNYRSLKLLGLPDHIIQGGDIVPGETALLKGRLNQYVFDLAQAGLGSRFKMPNSPGGKIKTYFPKEADNQLVCLGIDGPVPAVDSLVTLSGMKPFSKLNRTWRVADSAANDPNFGDYIYLAGSSDINTFGPVEGGRYTIANYEVIVLNSYSISRISPRKVGIPFGTARGRR